MNPTETRELMRDIRRIREGGVTILLIEHDMGVVRGICDRVAALDHGTKIAEGSFEEVRRNPAVLAAYLGRQAGSAEANRRRPPLRAPPTPDVGQRDGAAR